jgi:hypothetical protein
VNRGHVPNEELARFMFVNQTGEPVESALHIKKWQTLSTCVAVRKRIVLRKILGCS